MSKNPFAVYIRIDYDINHGVFCYETNCKERALSGLIGAFIRSQMGNGKDDSKAEEHELYEIDVEMDMTEGNFKCRHNCGNKGLREGILMVFWAKLNRRQAWLDKVKEEFGGKSE